MLYAQCSIIYNALPFGQRATCPVISATTTFSMQVAHPIISMRAALLIICMSGHQHDHHIQHAGTMSGHQHEPTAFSTGVVHPIISVTMTFNMRVACSSEWQHIQFPA